MQQLLTLNADEVFDPIRILSLLLFILFLLVLFLSLIVNHINSVFLSGHPLNLSLPVCLHFFLFNVTLLFRLLIPLPLPSLLFLLLSYPFFLIS